MTFHVNAGYELKFFNPDSPGSIVDEGTTTLNTSGIVATEPSSLQSEIENKMHSELENGEFSLMLQHRIPGTPLLSVTLVDSDTAEVSGETNGFTTSAGTNVNITTTTTTTSQNEANPSDEIGSIPMLNVTTNRYSCDQLLQNNYATALKVPYLLEILINDVVYLGPHSDRIPLHKNDT